LCYKIHKWIDKQELDYFNLLSEANFCATLMNFCVMILKPINFNLLSEANFCATEFKDKFMAFSVIFQSSFWS